MWPRDCDASLESIALADEAVSACPHSPRLLCMRADLIQVGPEKNAHIRSMRRWPRTAAAWSLIRSMLKHGSQLATITMRCLMMRVPQLRHSHRQPAIVIVAIDSHASAYCGSSSTAPLYEASASSSGCRRLVCGPTWIRSAPDQRRGECGHADTASSASAMDSSEASQSRGHIPLRQLMYSLSVITAHKPKRAASATGSGRRSLSSWPLTRTALPPFAEAAQIALTLRARDSASLPSLRQDRARSGQCYLCWLSPRQANSPRPQDGFLDAAPSMLGPATQAIPTHFSSQLPPAKPEA